MKGNFRVKEPGIAPLNPVCYCRRAVGSIGTLDGNLDKPFWESAQWLDDFHDIEGDSMPRPAKQFCGNLQASCAKGFLVAILKILVNGVKLPFFLRGQV